MVSVFPSIFSLYVACVHMDTQQFTIKTYTVIIINFMVEQLIQMKGIAR